MPESLFCRAVIFDLDGTLLNTLEDLADSMNWVLRENKCPPHPVDAYRYLVGNGMEQLVRRALPQTRRDLLTIGKCMAEMRAYYSRNWKVKSKPYDGIETMLRKLQERGLPLNVLSNKPDEFTRQCVAELLPPVFTEVRGVRPEVPRKPDPAGALAIAKALAMAPAEFLYIGDTNTDMQTAIAAGMDPVGVLWGFRDRQELLDSGARTLVTAPAELPNLPQLQSPAN